MPITAFQPSGNSALVAASSSTVGTATQVSTGGQQGMYLANPSTVPVYFLAGQTSAVQAAVPTTALPAGGLCIPAGQSKDIWAPPGGWLSAVTSAGAASVFATPGFYG